MHDGNPHSSNELPSEEPILASLAEPAEAPSDIPGIIPGRVADNVSRSRRRSRIWTSIAVVGVSLFAIVITSVVVQLLAFAIFVGNPLEEGAFLDPKATEKIFQSRGGLAMMVIVPQLALLFPSLIAAWLSPVPLVQRLGLERGRWPYWAWLSAAAVTPLIGLISTVFLGLFLDESESLKEMGAIFRGHGQSGFLIPLALMIGATPAVCEEVLFRGYVQTRMTNAMHPILGIAFASILFAAFHMDPVHSLAVFPLGIYLGWLTWQSRSLWPAMLAHFFNNAISVVFMTIAPEENAQALAMPTVATFLFILFLSGLGIIGVVIAFYLYPNSNHAEPR